MRYLSLIVVTWLLAVAKSMVVNEDFIAAKRSLYDPYGTADIKETSLYLNSTNKGLFTRGGSGKRTKCGTGKPPRTLAKRTMIVPEPGQENFDDFINSEVEDAEEIIHTSEINTSIYRDFGTFAFSIGAQGLKGCTVMFVISRNGVWAGHWYENISFDPDTEWLEGTTKEGLFQQFVLDGIQNGIAGAQESLQKNAGKLANPTVILIIPDKGTNGEPDPYRADWNRMKKLVVEQIFENKIKEYKEVYYETFDDLDENGNMIPEPPKFTNGGLGRLLFKYESMENKSPTPHLVKMWVEKADPIVYNDVF